MRVHVVGYERIKEICAFVVVMRNAAYFFVFLVVYDGYSLQSHGLKKSHSNMLSHTRKELGTEIVMAY